MILDTTRLERAKIRNGKLEARCPACAANGEDSTGNHLFIENEGRGPRWGCVINPGPAGSEHRRLIAALVGTRSATGRQALQTSSDDTGITSELDDRPGPTLPVLRRPSNDELTAIMELRGWAVHKGLELLAERGLLWDASIYDNGAEWPAWVITDSLRLNAQARTYDGAPWEGIGGKKAKSLPGSWANWPIGAPDIDSRPNVVLCEGQPDFCAALYVAWFENRQHVETVAPVCMTGAGNAIHREALRFFTGKRVRIMTHNDEKGQGQAAAKRWAQQLIEASAAFVDQVCFDDLGLTQRNGRPLKDLADYATLLDVEFCPDAPIFADWFD